MSTVKYRKRYIGAHSVASTTWSNCLVTCDGRTMLLIEARSRRSQYNSQSGSGCKWFVQGRSQHTPTDDCHSRTRFKILPCLGVYPNAGDIWSPTAGAGVPFAWCLRVMSPSASLGYSEPRHPERIGTEAPGCRSRLDYKSSEGVLVGCIHSKKKIFTYGRASQPLKLRNYNRNIIRFFYADCGILPNNRPKDKSSG